MDDMQSRIAARRAEIERQRRAAKSIGEYDEGATADHDLTDSLEISFEGRSSPSGSADQSGDARPGNVERTGTHASMQHRIAARRAEIDRERERAEVEAATTAEREWADQARQRKEQIDREASAAPGEKSDQVRRAAVDLLLREAIRRRWTTNQRRGVWVMVIAGVLLLSWRPDVGAIVMLLGVAMYAATNSTHRAEALREYPDLFGSGETPQKP